MIIGIYFVYRHLPIKARRFVDRHRRFRAPKQGRLPGKSGETMDMGESLEVKVTRSVE